VVTKFLIIPPAAFRPAEEWIDYYNWGLGLGLNSGTGGFSAPVYLPAGSRIRAMRLYAFDANSFDDIVLELYETRPNSHTNFRIKYVNTRGDSGTQHLIKYISYPVKRYYGYYVYLEYPASDNLETFGVLIKYTVNQ
jgi:hypothetical protein